MLRCSLHPGFRLGRSRCVGCGPRLPVSRISNRVHGVARCRNRSVRLPTSTSQCFRSLRADRLSSTACLGAHVETRSDGKISNFLFVDSLRAHMHRHRPESKFARPTGTGLAVRQAYLRFSAKSTLRCLVRVVCCCWPFPVSKETMRTLRNRSNQSMKPTAPGRSNFSVFATVPCRGLSLSR